MFFSWIYRISFNILTLITALLFLAKYFNISNPDSDGFLKYLRKYLPRLDTGWEDSRTQEELDDLKQNEEWDEIVEDHSNDRIFYNETLIGLPPSLALEFENFSEVIQKHVKECDETKLEDLLKRWSGDIIELAEGKDDSISIICSQEIQEIPGRNKKRRKQCSIS